MSLQRCLRLRFISALHHPSRFISCSRWNGKQIEPRKEPSDGGQLQTGTFTKKAKENVKTASYSVIVIAGIGVTAAVLYIIFKELFSGDSPQKLFQNASEKCIQHEKVQDLLGEPIKAYGEQTRRHKSKHVKHMYYKDDEGKTGLRIQFHLHGLRRSAVAELDAREEVIGGKMKIRYIIITTDDMYKNSVIVEDNRS